jgi:hypothetical protein
MITTLSLNMLSVSAYPTVGYGDAFAEGMNPAHQEIVGERAG